MINQPDGPNVYPGVIIDYKGEVRRLHLFLIELVFLFVCCWEKVEGGGGGCCPDIANLVNGCSPSPFILTKDMRSEEWASWLRPTVIYSQILMSKS